MKSRIHLHPNDNISRLTHNYTQLLHAYRFLSSGYSLASTRSFISSNFIKYLFRRSYNFMNSRRGTVTECPECFEVVFRLMSRKAFRDLGNHDFTGEEKDFIVGEVMLIDKDEFEQLLIDPIFDVAQTKSSGASKVTQRYKIPFETVKKWCIEARRLENILGFSGGRPPALDQISIDKLVEAHILAEVPTVDGIRPFSERASNQLFLAEKINTYN